MGSTYCSDLISLCTSGTRTSSSSADNERTPRFSCSAKSPSDDDGHGSLYLVRAGRCVYVQEVVVVGQIPEIA